MEREEITAVSQLYDIILFVQVDRLSLPKSKHQNIAAAMDQMPQWQWPVCAMFVIIFSFNYHVFVAQQPTNPDSL